MSHRHRRIAPSRGPRRVANLPMNGPSALKTNVEIRHRYRFVSTSNASTTITDTTLIGAVGVMAVAATVGRPLAQTVKVNRIEVWTPPASQGSAATCSILFPSSNNSPAREFSDTSVSVSTPAHIATVPPAQSLSSFWQAGSGVTMFTMVAPTGSIIDVWLSIVLNDGTFGGASTLVAGSIGVVYYMPLDATSAAGVYKPVSLTTL